MTYAGFGKYALGMLLLDNGKFRKGVEVLKHDYTQLSAVEQPSHSAIWRCLVNTVSYHAVLDAEDQFLKSIPLYIVQVRGILFIRLDNPKFAAAQFRKTLSLCGSLTEKELEEKIIVNDELELASVGEYLQDDSPLVTAKLNLQCLGLATHF
ncbi:hypothetical protein HDU98_002343 [Podochytrium sp. JEL0797]|nr:hypothetical protein HDU98_002343 [Podochytrium sp. JEL0797]